MLLLLLMTLPGLVLMILIMLVVTMLQELITDEVGVVCSRSLLTKLLQLLHPYCLHARHTPED